MRHRTLPPSLSPLLLLVALLVTIVLLPYRPLQAADIVRVTSSDLQGWTLTEEAPNTNQRFVAGPDAPPAGDGSLFLGAGATGRIAAATRDLQGTSLDDLDGLTYHTYTTNGPVNHTMTLRLAVDDDVTDVAETASLQLLFQPGRAAPVMHDEWQQWDAGALAGWSVEPPAATGCTSATPCTLAQLQTALPNAGIAADGGTVAFVAAGDGGTALAAYADRLSLTVNTVETIYDFELEQCTATCYVDSINGDDSLSGRTPGEAKRSIGAAVAQVNPGGDVIVAGGFYGEAGIAVDKALTIVGVSRLSTLVDGGGADIFAINAGGVRLQGMTLQNGARGVRIEQKDASPIAAVTLDDVRIRQQRVAGVAVGADTALSNLTIVESQFAQNAAGVRLENTAVVDGLTVEESAFTRNETAIAQLNGGERGKLRNLTVRAVAFDDNSDAAISLQECASCLVDASDFVGNGRGFILEKQFTTSQQPAGGITIQDNTFQNNRGAALTIAIRNSALGAAVVVRGNQFSQSANLLSAVTPLAHIKLGSGQAHASVEIQANDFTFSGVRGVGVDAVFAVQLTGGARTVSVMENRFDGGSVGSSSSRPATAGIYLQSDDVDYGAPAADAAIQILSNAITGFVDGIVIHDATTNQHGGLSAAADVTVRDNTLAGNSATGVRNGPGALLNAQRNWWGAPSGPGPVAGGTGDGVSGNVLFCPWLDGPAPSGQPASPSGGFATVSSDGFTTQYCTIEEAAFAAQGSDQIVRVAAGIWPPEHFGRDYSDAPGLTVTAATTRTDTVLTGLLLDGATLDGLAFDNLTLTGTAAPTRTYSVAAVAGGDYRGLAFTNNLFDGGGASERGAMHMEDAAADTVLRNNQFRNYGATQISVPSLVSLRAEGAPPGDGLTVRGNQLDAVPHARAIDIFHWHDVTVAGNRVRQGTIALGGRADAAPGPLGVTRIISNELMLDGAAVGLQLSTLQAPTIIAGNRIENATTCLQATGVVSSTFTGNRLFDCSARGLLLEDNALAPASAVIRNNAFITGSIGIENRAALALDVCENLFVNIDQATNANPGPFIDCPVLIQAYEDLNRNGMRDPGESGLAGWEFSVLQDVEVYASGVTDSSGELRLLDIPPGDYEVCQTLREGWINTGEACQPLIAGPGQVNLLRFGNVPSGEIVIHKRARPADGTAFAYITTIPESDGGFTLYGLSEDGADVGVSLPITASNVITFSDVPVGVYTVTESLTNDWLLTDLTCADPTDNSTISIDAATARIRLDAGERITCRFQNQASGGIAVIKQTRPGGLVGPFAFAGALSGRLDHGGRIVRNGLPPGEYQVQENDLPAGFELSAITCDDEDSSIDLENRSATYRIAAGEFVSCTFVNQLTGIDVTPSVAVSEEGETDVYVMTLATPPQAELTVMIQPDEQVTVAPPALVITSENWDDLHTVTVTAVDDNVAESPPGTVHFGRIRHAVVSADPYYDGIPVREVLASIVDNDYPGVLIEPTLLTVVDSTDVLTYTIQLASRPDAAVAIDIETGPEVTVSPVALLLTPDDWTQPQTVRVAVAAEDPLAVSEILHIVRSIDPTYDGIDASSVLVTQEPLGVNAYLPLISR